MFRELETVEDLFADIKKEANIALSPNRRYPIRFIFTNDFKQFQDLMIELRTYINDNYIDLSRESNPNTFPTKKDVFTYIKNLLEHTKSVIYPVSEIIRFYKTEEFISFFNYLMSSVENNSTVNKRIYIPLYGILTPFKKHVVEKFGRKNQWAPIWILKSDKDYKSKLYPLKMQVPMELNIVESVSDWLSIWLKKHSKKYFSTSSSLNYFLLNKQDSDSLTRDTIIDDVLSISKDVTNFKDLISAYYDKDFDIEYIEQEADYWEYLFYRLNENNNYINELGSYKKITHQAKEKGDLYKNFIKEFIKSKPPKEKWLLAKLFLSHYKSELSNDSFYLCVDSLAEYTDSELIKVIWLSAFDKKLNDTWLNDRYSLLKYIHKSFDFPIYDINQEIESHLIVHKELVINKPDILTGILESENMFVLSILKKDSSFISKPVFRDRFAYLFEYINWDNIDICLQNKDQWIKDYFVAYCLGKLTWDKLPEIDKILKEINKDEESFYEWWYKCSLPSHNEPGYTIYWIDGLGAEWAPLLYHLLLDCDKDDKWEIADFDLRRVYLPTTTVVNRINTEHHLLELDTYNHNNQASNNLNKHLLSQISILESIVKKILSSGKDKIIISSDHGASYLCLKEFCNEDGLGLTNNKHGGRYKWIDSNSKYYSDKIKIVHEVEALYKKGEKCLVAISHQSLGDRIPFESHGGATPEEILIPFVKLERKNRTKDKSKKFIITPDTFKDIKEIEPIIVMAIKPTPHSVPLLKIQEKQFKLFCKNRKWSCRLEGIKAGKHTVTILIDGFEVKKEINITKSGMIEEDLF